MNSLRSLVLTAFGLTTTAVGSVGCAGEPVYAEEGLALRGYDPIVLLEDQVLVEGSPDFASSYRGAQFEFASSANRDAFDADPEALSPQFGGWCTVGISDGVYWPGDPTFHDVREGKLYIFADPPALEWYRSDPEIFIRRAEAMWSAKESLRGPEVR